MLRSRGVQAFVVILIVGGLLSGAAFSLGFRGPRYWIGVLGAAVCGAYLATRGSRSASGSKIEFLCDSCKYNDARYCGRPERPNATRCPDYKER